MREIEADELEALAIGAGVLGTGGGNHPHLELMCAQEAYARGKRVRMLDPAELDDDARVAVLAFMGAPLVTKERLPEPVSACRAVRLMEAHVGRRFDAVMSVEIGGENAFLPLLVGMELDLPVVDADVMGRAFPEVQMTSFAIRGLPMAPFAIADIRDNALIIAHAENAGWTERLGRRAVVELGSIAGTCGAPRTGAEVKAHAILGSTSRAIRLGRAVERARRAHADPVAAILAAESGALLLRGKVEDVSRRMAEGFVRGQARLGGTGTDAGRTLLIDFQNEFSAAREDGAVLASVPDLITILDAVTGEAIGAEVIRYGQRVAVIALPADPIMTSPAGLAAVGPRAFGFDFDYTPFARRAGAGGEARP
ncbi:DUF917 domain-containing protein [Ancylobacter lacus]|uniref:DUF917 domain-containing protein n=1 Tax=Ancylobacter lacus TaxID=2579970 RepID=UPI001BCFA93A|nr:DUF917 domain-containing protein [Ancylobacter lacus]MBS7538246.1 DUF917 domain-containing protein [Ancylobacter lacus]